MIKVHVLQKPKWPASSELNSIDTPAKNVLKEPKNKYSPTQVLDKNQS